VLHHLLLLSAGQPVLLQHELRLVQGSREQRPQGEHVLVFVYLLCRVVYYVYDRMCVQWRWTLYDLQSSCYVIFRPHFRYKVFLLALTTSFTHHCLHPQMGSQIYVHNVLPVEVQPKDPKTLKK